MTHAGADLLISGASSDCGGKSNRFSHVRSISSRSPCRRNGCVKRSRRIASLPSDKPLQRLNDILESIERILEYTREQGYVEFAGDRLTRDAVERCLLRISEAARKLEGVVDNIASDQP